MHIHKPIPKFIHIHMYIYIHIHIHVHTHIHIYIHIITGHPLVSVARICVSALVACCYPLSINPGRKVILAVMAHMDPDDVEITERTLLMRFAVVTVS